MSDITPIPPGTGSEPTDDRDGDIPAASQRKDSAWERLLEMNRPYLMSIAEAEFPRSLAPKLGPSDLVQMTLAKGHIRAAEFRGSSREELARWLRQILLNQLTDISREHARESRGIPLDAADVRDLPERGRLTPCGETLSREERELLDAALLRLPDLYRRVILWRHSEDLSFDEIGRRIGRSDEAARKLWTRGLQKLQGELGIDGER